MAALLKQYRAKVINFLYTIKKLFIGEKLDLRCITLCIARTKKNPTHMLLDIFSYTRTSYIYDESVCGNLCGGQLTSAACSFYMCWCITEEPRRRDNIGSVRFLVSRCRRAEVFIFVHVFIFICATQVAEVVVLGLIYAHKNAPTDQE